MALKSNLSILTISFIFILVTTSLPSGPVQALDRDMIRLPVLEAFISQVKNGEPEELRGVYVPGVLAARVVQQPASRNNFVAFGQNVVTQFAQASRLGSTGLLAHNYLAGESFSLLEYGQGFHLIYGDGRVSTFMVTETLYYQALEPTNPLSEFVSLDNGGMQTASEVFAEVYNRPGRVIFQTCIAAEESSSWGRLFVIAEPYYNTKHSTPLTSMRLRWPRSK